MAFPLSETYRFAFPCVFDIACRGIIDQMLSAVNKKIYPILSVSVDGHVSPYYNSMGALLGRNEKANYSDSKVI